MSELAVTALADRPRDKHRLWYNFEIIRRTFRTPGVDRPPFILEIHQRQQCLWYKLSNSRRTVRGTDLDTMEVGELVGEIRAHEMGILGMSEEPT